MPTKILLIEDNPDHILFTKRILKNAGQSHQLDSAGTGKEGIEMVVKESYDLILCDYRLPDLNALEVLRRIKEKGQDLPFVVVTAAGSEKIAVELMKEGAYDYLVKDLTYNDTLPMVINRSLENYRIKKEKEKLESSLKEAYEGLKRAQEELIQTEKMAALGTLSAGMAHEINNPLMGVMLLVQSLVSEKGEGSEEHKALKQIENGLKRIAEVIHKLLTFSRKEKLVLKKLEINDIIELTIPLIKHEFELNNIEIKRDYGRDLPNVEVSTNAMQQVLMNILLNAKDTVLNSKSKKVTITTYLENDMVKVKIKDEGCGIKKENLKKVFNPFFTTKPVGKGLGMGMPIVRTIMDQHRGKVDIRSEEQKGTEVILSLPAFG